MSEHYDVPVEVVKLYGKLEKAYASLLPSEKIQDTEINRLIGIVEDIKEYKHLIGNNVYMYEDMMNTDRLNKLETFCRNLLSIAEDKVKEIIKNH